MGKEPEAFVVKETNLSELDSIFDSGKESSAVSQEWKTASHTQIEKEIKDSERELTLFEKKMKRMFGGANNVRSLFFTGFKMGAAGGGIFGGVMGTYYAVTTRTISMIPISIFGTGLSFGFFMGMGMVLRQGNMESIDDSTDYMIETINSEGRREFSKPAIFEDNIV